MVEIKISRPKFPKGYADNPTASLEWSHIVQRLTQSKNYWMCSVSPSNRVHSVPRWGVFLDGKLYYDGSPETRHAQNISLNPNISVHLESGDEALIAEGITVAAPKPESELAARLAKSFCEKYEKFGYAPSANQWDDGGLFVFTPSKVLAWTVFFENPTKFTLTY